MNHPTDDQATRLRDELDRLASSASAGTGEDGAQLYRRSLRRRRGRVAATTGLVAAATAPVVVGGATWLPGDEDGALSPKANFRSQGRQRRGSRPGVGRSRRPRRTYRGQAVEVSQAEAALRCTTVWHNFWGESAIRSSCAPTPARRSRATRSRSLTPTSSTTAPATR